LWSCGQSLLWTGFTVLSIYSIYDESKNRINMDSNLFKTIKNGEFG
jgi:hypothetical protein